LTPSALVRTFYRFLPEPDLASPRAVAVALLFLTGIAACDKVTGGGGGGAVLAVEAVTEGTELGPDDTLPLITCTVVVHALATGNDGEGDAWGRAIFRYYAGTDRSNVAIDSQTLDQSTVDQDWNGGIPVGQPRDTHWVFRGTFPFTGRLEFHYRQGNDPNAPDHTATTQFNCGAEPASASPPTATVVKLDPGNDLNPGSTLTVSYTGTGNTPGVWLSLVRLSGPCTTQKRYFDRNQAHVSRTVTIQVPMTCSLGSRLTVTVVAADYMGQSGSTPATGPLVTDNTSPRLRVFQNGSSTPGVGGGTYFTGDAINVRLVATDNAQLQAITLAIPSLGLTQQISAAGTGLTLDTTIVFPQAWVGAQELLFFARDATGLYSDTTRTPPGAFSIHANSSHAAVNGSIAGTTDAVVLDVKRNVLYLLDRGAHKVNIVSIATVASAGSITLPSEALDMDLTMSGDSLAIALPHEHGIGFFDLTQSAHPYSITPLTVLNTAADEWPVYLRVAANGRLFTGVQPSTGGTWRVAELNLSNGAQRIRTDAGNGINAGPLIGRTFDHQTLFFNGGPGPFFQRYQSGTNTFGPPRTSPADYFPVVSDDGQRVDIGTDVYSADLQLQYHLPVGGDPGGAAFDGTGASIYQMVNYVYQSALADGHIIERFPSVDSGKLWLVHGSMMVTTGSSNGTTTISVIDLSN
jgi:hypothetical protein